MVDKEEFRNNIIETARLIFSKKGYRKTTMDDIANKLGKGKSSIYYYFPGKEEIYCAVIEKESVLMRDTIEKEINKISKPAEKLNIYVTVRMNAFRNMVNFYEAIKNELLKNIDFINKIREKYNREEIDTVSRILTEGIKDNSFDVENPELTAIAIVTAIKGLEIPLIRQRNFIEYDKHITHLLRVLFFGIVKR